MAEILSDEHAMLRPGLARLKGSPLDKLIWEGHGIDVCVFPQ